MRFMIIVKGTAATESDAPTSETRLAPMAAYHEELARAGVLLDATGLQPSSRGWRIRYSNGQRTTVDGPFAETRELIAGYTLIQVRSKEEAMEWVRRFPPPHGELAEGEIEVRQLTEPDDFAPGASADRLRQPDLARK